MKYYVADNIIFLMWRSLLGGPEYFPARAEKSQIT